MSVLLWPELVRLSRQAQRRFGLRAFVLEPVTHPRARHYGTCEVDARPAVIALRVHRLDMRRPLARATILDTLAHELAHLRHPTHSPEWRALYRDIATDLRGAP